MKTHRLALTVSFFALCLATSAYADDTAQPVPVPGNVLSGVDDPTDDDDAADLSTGGEIVVMAARINGQVDAPEAPIETLNEADIAAYGATSLTDLLSALSPQTGSGRGRGGGMPVMLLNGQRISSFREMRNIPPEAIRRMEILPEEVALRFGYSADQRVVNIILKNQFSAVTGELEYGQSWRGGTSNKEGELSLFNVTGQNRLNVTGSYEWTTPLTEAERGVISNPGSVPTVAGDPDPAFARTLVRSSENADFNAVWSRGFGAKGQGGLITLNGTASRTSSAGLSGLNTVVLVDPLGNSAVRTFGDPLESRTQTTTLSGGVALNKSLGSWQLSATLDANRTDADTRIARRSDTTALVAAAAAGTLPINGALPDVVGSGDDRALTRTDTVSGLVTLVGRPLRLPGGEVNATFKAGYSFAAIDSEDSRSLAGPTRLTRNTLSTGINLGVPITSRRESFGDAIGDLSLNLSAGVEDLSDFGTLKDWSAGLTWAPTEKLNLQASYIVNEQAPSLSNLGAPLTSTLNVPVYDFVRGETALVTIVSGGNPALLRERDRDIKLGLNWKLPVFSSANLIVEYFRNNSDNVTAAFPVLTPDIEAAFPGRVVRDSTGRLIAIDRRAVTFANQKASRLRYGLNVSGTVGKAAPGAGGMGPGGPGGPGGGPRGGGMRMGGGGGPGGPGGFGPMGGGGGQGRWNLAAYHTIQFENRVLVSPGGPVLDLLNGDALSDGGTPRHSFEFEGGVFRKGKGLRLSGTYVAPVTVKGTGAPGSSDLRFGALMRVNLRAFIDLGQQKWLTRESGFFKGARLALRMDNLFDARQKVTDAAGTVPISYQPDLIDPQGRTFAIEFRKQF